jgi:hypothetical protein
MAQGTRAVALLYLGYPQRALVASQEAMTCVRDLGHAYSKSVVLWGAMVVHAYYRDWRTVGDVVAELSVLGSIYGLSFC